MKQINRRRWTAAEVNEVLDLWPDRKKAAKKLKRTEAAIQTLVTKIKKQHPMPRRKKAKKSRIESLISSVVKALSRV